MLSEEGIRNIQDEPRGEVILGTLDPRTLTPEQFRVQPSVLYHGAGSEFTFSQDFDYKAFIKSNPHSQTIGAGFYATPVRRDAELFSVAFGGKEQPIVYELLPFQARMFDFRGRVDPLHNAPVSPTMFREYTQFCEARFKNNYGDDPDEYSTRQEEIPGEETVDEPSSSPGLDSFFAKTRPVRTKEETRKIKRQMDWRAAKEYLIVLQNLAIASNVDLRLMLSINGNAAASEYASDQFPEFMKQQGFDGVIYIEGGDHPEHQKTHPVSYCFFDAKKIGTYESWHASKSNGDIHDVPPKISS